MSISLTLPQTIGKTFGDNFDGVLIGSCPFITPTTKYYSFDHEVSYAVQANNNEPISNTWTWTPVTNLLNTAASLLPFEPLNVANDPQELYLAVRPGVTGFDFNINTAGVGTFVISAEYSTELGYSPLTATYSTDFFKTVGIATMRFTPPEDWVATNIGYGAAPKEKWLRLIISSGSITTQPELLGALEFTAELEETNAGTSNPPFYNPYPTNLLARDEDRLYVSSPNKPFAMRVLYDAPMTAGNVTYKYMKEDLTLASLPILNDTSNGFTATNPQDFYILSLTSTAANAEYFSEQGTTDTIAAVGVVGVLPTATTDRVAVGLSESQSGVIKYSLRLNYTTEPVYEVYIDNVLTFTSTREPQLGDSMVVLRINGNVYFQVSGEYIYGASPLVPNENLLYFGANAIDNGTTFNVLNNVQDKRKFISLPMVGSTHNVNFTDSQVIVSLNAQEYFFVSFIPPVDMALIPALDSPTGEEGYVIVVENEMSAPSISNMRLNLLDVQSAETNDTVLFQTGSQYTVSTVNLLMQNTNTYLDESTFLLIYKNLVGTFYSSVTYPIPTQPTNILNGSITKLGVTNCGVVQVSGADELDVGLASEIYMGA